MAAAATSAGMAVSLVEQTHRERDLAEAFVRAVFLRAYNARIGSLYPLLLAIARDSRVPPAGRMPATAA